MIFGIFLRFMINTTILSAVIALLTKKHSRPEFADIFYLAAGVSFANMLLILLLFQKIGISVLIPCLAAGCYILMRFGGLAILHAIVILMVYEVIQFLLPI